MKYHTIALENIYTLMGFLADGILATKEGVGRLEVQVDHVEQDVSLLKTELTETEERIAVELRKEINPIKRDVAKLNKEVFS